MKNKSDRILANGDINYNSVRVTTAEGSTILPTYKAIQQAENAGLDLVLINDKTSPPVCRIIDVGKFRYEQKIKAKEAARAQRASRITVKEVQFKPNIDQHDFDTKCKNITKFLSKGNVVKVLIQFKGRQRQHTDIGFDIIDRVMETINDAQLEGKPQFSGNRITAILKGTQDGTKNA